ncbi:LuxR C-terminal-related transcriptional regulator [Nocardioides sp. LS1]|uniref:LuxR C-terminal-related transcriptional regulator n=1 Tax=Nocardioides sp. LS1 TaxID=1027620 RepID=UPI000F620DED|nr:LuxR C-terminal-related transcriptional regulator [Nocardioides sp. LS1]
MPRPAPDSMMTALGFPASVERIYQKVQLQSGRELLWVASALMSTPDQLLAELRPLLDTGIARVEDSRLYIDSPAEALARMAAVSAARAGEAHDRLEGLAAAIPFLTAGAVRPAPGDVHDITPIDGEISSGGQPVGLIAALIAQSKGDMLWLRPDQWRIPREDAMLKVVGDLIASGRKSRAIYPVRALHEAPATLTARAEVGEQIRVLPDLPTRMFIIGTTHAVLPEPMGFADEPRSLVRQRGLVEALTLLFELLWERAAPVPSLDRGEARPDLRRFLLQQLATGAQDEQIARTLGISLRTVRRRVADVLTELGADTRFQAGVEASRRGWL